MKKAFFWLCTVVSGSRPLRLRRRRAFQV